MGDPSRRHLHYETGRIVVLLNIDLMPFSSVCLVLAKHFLPFLVPSLCARVFGKEEKSGVKEATGEQEAATWYCRSAELGSADGDTAT
jgi:hypothetical protein